MSYHMDELIEAARQAREQAHAPYSGFRVGAALETEDGHLFSGCNVENVSFGATCCAERVAIFKAVSEGQRRIRQLAVICGSDDYCMPCGICRQVMLEFATPDFMLVAARPDGQYLRLTMEQLLPHAFTHLSPDGVRTEKDPPPGHR